jgi:DNA primase
MIAPGFIQELLSRVDIVDVVGRHVELRKGGANLMGLCPFHGEKSPSFSVSPSKQFYYCFGCGASGDAIKFLTEHTGIPFRDAVADLAQQVGLVVPDDDERSPEQRAEAARQKEQQATLTGVLARAGEFYRHQLKASPRAVDYLKQRGLTGEIAARFGLGYSPEGWRSLAGVFPRYDDPLLADAGLVIVQGEDTAEQKRYDRFRDRIMFPIRSVQGDVIGFGGRVLDRGEPKYLNSPETPVFVKGRELYGLFEARGAMRSRGYALVVEGYMDVVALAQLGFANAVATLGTACTEDHVRKLFRFTDSVVFSFDGDAAGRRAAGRALEASLPHASDLRTIRFLFLPSEHDPDSFVRSEGAEAFERCVAQAVPLSRQLVDLAREGCDLATPEGRARFLSQARPLWAALPEGALRRQMLGELARQAVLPDAELAALWAVARQRPAAESQPARPEPPAHRASGPQGAPSPRDRPGKPHRRAPRRPQDHIVHLLLTHAAWWEALSNEDHELLHALGAPHGPLLAWLERDLAEHGPRSWAVLQAALRADADLAPLLDQVLTSDPGDDQMTPADLRSALDVLLLDALRVRMEALLVAVPGDPQARSLYLELDERRRQLKQRSIDAAAA